MMKRICYIFLLTVAFALNNMVSSWSQTIQIIPERQAIGIILEPIGYYIVKYHSLKSTYKKDKKNYTATCGGIVFIDGIKVRQEVLQYALKEKQIGLGGIPAYIGDTNPRKFDEQKFSRPKLTFQKYMRANNYMM